MRRAITVFFWIAYALVEVWTLIYWGATWGLVGAFIAFILIPSPLLTPFVVHAHYGRYPSTYIVVLILGIIAFFVRGHLDDREHETIQPKVHGSLNCDD